MQWTKYHTIHLVKIYSNFQNFWCSFNSIICSVCYIQYTFITWLQTLWEGLGPLMVCQVWDQSEDSWIDWEHFLLLLVPDLGASLRIYKKETPWWKKEKIYLKCLINCTVFSNILTRWKYVPLEELQYWPQFHWVVYVKTVVSVKQQADGRYEGSDVVVNNLLVNAQHEYVSSKAGGPWEKTTWTKNIKLNDEVVDVSH